MITEREVESGGLRIHFYACGQVPSDSLLFIHGWASSGRMWLDTMTALASDWHCLAPDLPGHGLSDKPSFTWYSVTNFAETLGRCCESLGRLPRVAIGHSLGGAIAVELALRHPEQVRRLVLVNPVVSGRVSYNLHSLKGRVPRQTLLTISRRLWPRATRLLLRRAARERRRRLHEHEQRNLQDLAQTTADSVLGSARAAIYHDMTEKLAALTMPLLVIVGTRDTTIPPDEGRRLARCAQQGQLAELNAGHLPTDEQPHAFLEVLTRFLRSGSV